jgi:cytochrome c556
MKRTLLAAVAVTIGTTAVVAQANVIASRKAWMKENGTVTAQGGKMARGEEPFDIAKARAIFKTYGDTARRLPRLFPASAKTGGDTAALPAIWDKPAEWRAAVAKFRADVASEGRKIKDLDTFKAAFGNVTKNCGSCHEPFRAKRG